MNETDQQWQELMRRQLLGEPLSEDESETLRVTVPQDASLRRQHALYAKLQQEYASTQTETPTEDDRMAAAAAVEAVVPKRSVPVLAWVIAALLALAGAVALQLLR